MHVTKKRANDRSACHVMNPIHGIAINKITACLSCIYKNAVIMFNIFANAVV